MSTNDIHYFDYNPKWQITQGEAYSQKQCRVSYTIQQNELDTLLSEEQQAAILITIQKIINEEVYLDINKDHNLNITILEEDKFSIVIDNQTKFFISKQTVGGNEKIVAIQDKLESRSTFSFLKDFWKMILNLFYSPSFPNPSLKERSPQEAILQDYRGLRKTLESGQNWLTSKEIRISSNEEKKRELSNQVNDGIARAKKIEETLKQKNQSAAFKRLASEWAHEIYSTMDTSKQMVIPVGYLNSEGAFQPIMLRFYRNDMDELFLEIYCDSTEGAAKTTPTQIRQFAYPLETVLNDILDECFQPLIGKSIDKNLLEKVTSPNQFFGEVVEKQMSKSLMELGIKKPRSQNNLGTRIAKEPPLPQIHVTYESLIRALDAKAGNCWDPAADEKKEKLSRHPLTPASRVVKWFDHLIDQENFHLTRNEKLNLLFGLTNTWVEDQVKQLNKNTPLSKQLDIYEQCVGYIDHVIEKVAVSINQNHPLDTLGIPNYLKNKKAGYLQKIEKLRKQHRQETVEATIHLQEKVHSEEIKGISIEGLKAPIITKKSIEVSHPILPFDEEVWDRSWQDLSSLLMPERLQQHQAQQSVLNLTNVMQKAIAKIESENGNPDLLKNLLEGARKDPANLIMTEDGINRDLLTALLLETGYAKTILEDEYFQVSPATFIQLLSEFIACPFFLSQYKEEGAANIPYKAFFMLLRKIQDPNTSIPVHKKAAFETLRAILQIGQIIPKNKKEEYAKKAWAAQGKLYKGAQDPQEFNNNPTMQSYFKFLEAVSSDARYITPLTEVPSSPYLDPSLLNSNHVELDTEEFKTSLIKNVANLTQECRNIMRMAAGEEDIFRKKLFVEQARNKSLQILRALPPPGTEGTSGQPSIWYALSEPQRKEMLTTISELEHLAWESQMKLGITDLKGKDRFLFVKAQAIRFAIIRTEVALVQAQVEKILHDIFNTNPQIIIEAVHKKFITLNETQTAIVHLDLRNLWGSEVRELYQIINKQNLPPGSVPNLGILLLDSLTMDTFSYNQLLSQDLTACLSENGEKEEELLALYHFIVRDQNRGTTDSIQPFSDDLCRQSCFINSKELDASLDYQLVAKIPKEQYRSLNKDQAKNDFIFQTLEQIEKGEYYYRTAADPDFTLYMHSPMMGVTFFQAEPSKFLEQNTLDIQISEDETVILGNDDGALAKVFAAGNKDFAYYEENSQNYSEEEKKLRIQQKRPFLPVVNNANSISTLPDCRTLKNFDVWLSYVTECAQETTLAIPPQILQKLFLIRQSSFLTPSQGQTAYSHETAINALSFLADPSNLKYLKHEFVQQFLEESLFGSFVMQQALVEKPEAVLSKLLMVQECLTQASNENHYEAIGFLSNVIRQIHTHAQFTQKNLNSFGLLSGLYNGSLPSMLSFTGGAFHAYLTEFRNKFIGMENPNVTDPKQTVQPLLYKMEMVNACVNTLEDIVTKAPSPIDLYFSGNIGERAIDLVKDPKIKKQWYTHALQELRLASKYFPLNLSPDFFQFILEGVQLLLDENIESSLPSQQEDIIVWFREIILPEFQNLDPLLKSKILTSLVNQQLKKPIHGDAEWKSEKNFPSLYSCHLADNDISIELSTMKILNIESQRRIQTKAFIPKEVLQRTDVQQAIKSNKIMAHVSSNGNETKYSWEHQGQHFEINVRGPLVKISRKTEGIEYIFHPINTENTNSAAHGMLAENGLWISPKMPSSGFIFTSGQNKPEEYETYHTLIENGEVKRIETTAGDRVSSSTIKESPSAFLFANADDTLIMINPIDKKPQEIRLKNTDLVFKEDNGKWRCYQNGQDLGKMTYPPDEKHLVERFGENWDQYIIPLEKDGKMQYLLLPYKQTISKDGKMSVDHTSLSEIPKGELISLNENDTIDSSIAAHLYLTHRLLLQAFYEKNTTIARTLYSKANQHIQQLQSLRPSTDPDKLKSLFYALELIAKSPPITLHKVTSPEALALSLKLHLTMRKIRERAPEQKLLQLSLKENSQELEFITKMYQAYGVMEQSGKFAGFRNEDLHKAVVLLKNSERNELLSISQQLLQSLQDEIEAETLQTYFGATGRLETSLQMEKADHLNPNFLLTLLRIAKPANPVIDISKITSPLPLDNLLENFWSYFVSIKEKHIKPEQLLFLFEESLIPPAKSAEEEANLKAIDLQARQFLLMMADLQSEFGKTNSPKKLIEQSIEEAKSSLDELNLNKEKYGRWLGGVKNDLKMQFDNFIFGINSLTLETEKRKIGPAGGELEIPNIDKLSRDIKEIETKITVLTDSLAEVNQVALAFIKQYKDIEGKFKSETEKQIWLATFVKDPVTGKTLPINFIIDGSYKNELKLDELQMFTLRCSEIQQELRKTIAESRDKRNKLEKWIELEITIANLKNSILLPQHDLSFPTNEVSQQKIEEILKKDIKPADILKDIFKESELGLIEKGKLISHLYDYHTGRLAEKTKLFSIPLMLLAMSAKNEEIKKTILVENKVLDKNKKLGAQKPLNIANIQDHPAAKKCFSPEQLETLIDKLNNVSPEKQPFLIERLTLALNQTNDTIVASQISVARNIEESNVIYDKKFSPTAPPPSLPGSVHIGINVVNDFDFLKYFKEPKISKSDFDKQHLTLVQNLIDTTLPEQNSLYAQDLKKGFENLMSVNPMPYSEMVNEDMIEVLKTDLANEIVSRKELLEDQKTNIINLLKTAAPSSLPKELQQIRFRNGSNQELLGMAYRMHRQGRFAGGRLDELIAKCQIDETRLKLLESAKYNATKSLEELFKLKTEKIELQRLGDVEKLKALESKWMRESNRLKDCLERCQSSENIEKLPERLKAHTRKIIYLQNRLGIVLRKDQIDALDEMIKKPALLKQLRMGLGKTSTLLPFALEILGSEGFSPIGIVPRALFNTNFDEMDETTRVVFELCGNQFLFSRQDVLKPFSTLSLQQISHKCLSFFKAFDQGEYVLTTIESKASLDDKIAEIELSQLELISKFEKAKDSQRKELAINLTEHQTALDLLYRVKGVFEHQYTRIIVDEIDQVARATYSVNSEIGLKEAPSQLLRNTASQIFDLIREHPELKNLREQIFNNNQFVLTDAQVNSFLKTIGRIWLDQNSHKLHKKFINSQEAICAWLSGNESPFTASDVALLGPFATELKVFRKGLNSALRASLSLKIGLNTELDPIHSVVGVPASQGVTSKTTKFSDPLMQLCLTHMIAMYKPHGEPFLKSTVAEVYDSLVQDLKNLEKDDSEATATRRALVSEGIEKLKTFLEWQKKGERSLLYSQELHGNEPWKVFLRQQFANMAATQKLINVSENQISRPVQLSLRGCHIIGLTGTATRNTEHLIASTGYQKGMKSIEKTGRESTAEVVYRLAKSLPKGLETPIKTYSLNSNKALGQFKTFARKESGYTFLINQAGACDTFSQKEIVSALHLAGKRPIIFLNIETGKKSVMINSVVKSLDDLNSEEKQIVELEGFYYYHTPHARGTHFDLPTGAKGALMLSPKVNANDRDQAVYRAREIGEGHTVIPYISEKQYRELLPKGEKYVTLGQLLKIHHNQTQQDESKEDLSSYQLHIQGFLTSAIDRSKKNLQLLTPAKTTVEQLYDIELEISNITSKAKAFEIVKSFFIQENGNEAYLRQLDREIYQGGEIGTKEHLLNMIDGQITRAKKLLQTIDEKAQSSDLILKNSLSIVSNEVNSALNELFEEKEKFKNWAKISIQLPETVSSASVEISETEAEQEAQGEQESTSESAAESQKYNRNLATKSILREENQGILNSLESKMIPSLSRSEVITSMGDLSLAQTISSLTNFWKPNMFVTQRLGYQFKVASATTIPDMRFIVINLGNQYEIVLADPFEADLATSQYSRFQKPLPPEAPKGEQRSLLQGCTIHPTFGPDGKLQLIYETSATWMKDMRKDLNNHNFEAELLLSLLHQGFYQFTDNHWDTMRNYWNSLNTNDQQILKRSLETKLSKDPTLRDRASIYLWNQK